MRCFDRIAVKTRAVTDPRARDDLLTTRAWIEVDTTCTLLTSAPVRLLVVLVLVGALAGCAPLGLGGDPVLVGAGDIASCASAGSAATAALLDAIPGDVFADGDTVYDNETRADFDSCYGPTWGRHKART